MIMTSFTLTKNQPFNLTKSAPALRKIRFGMGWDTNQVVNGKDFDLDVSAILVGDDNLMIDRQSYGGYVGYVREGYSAHGVVYGGDNRDGQGDGDNEFLEVDLDKVGFEVKRIVIATTIYAGRSRKQNFSQVRNAFIRLHDMETDNEVARLNLSSTAGSVATAIIFGELVRTTTGWSFTSNESPIEGGLSGVLGKYGITIPEEVE